MTSLQDQNFKIKIQILDEQDNVLISSVISQQDINGLNVYQGVSLVDQTYIMLLDELQKNQQIEQ